MIDGGMTGSGLLGGGVETRGEDWSYYAKPTGQPLIDFVRSQGWNGDPGLPTDSLDSLGRYVNGRLAPLTGPAALRKLAARRHGPGRLTGAEARRALLNRIKLDPWDARTDGRTALRMIERCRRCP